MTSLKNSRLGLFCLILVGPALAAGLVRADWSRIGAASGSPADQGRFDPAATKVLKAMCAHMARARTLKVTGDIMFDVVGPTGIKSLVAMDVLGYVKRPNRLHFRYRRDDGANRFIWYDGETLSKFEPHQKAYTSLEVSKKSVGALLEHLIDNYDLKLTLADFFYDDPFAAFSEHLVSSKHNGLRYVDGVVCDYLHFESEAADFQLWVSTGSNPVPLRIVVTYVNKKGEPQYIANIRWKFDEYLDDGMFLFTPPAGVEKLPMKERK